MITLLVPVFEGGAPGVLGATAVAATLIIGAVLLDRRLDRWLGRLRGTRLSSLAGRTALVRVGLWTLTLAVGLAAAAKLSPPLAWLMVPAGALALALAVTELLRDALTGVSRALGRRLQKGDWIAVGELEGVVVRVGIRLLLVERSDGTVVEVPQNQLAEHGIRQLRAESGGHPVIVDLPLPANLDLSAVVEDARLAAALAPHAHLASKPVVVPTEADPPKLRVHGVCTSPFAADKWRAEVAVAYNAATTRRRK